MYVYIYFWMYTHAVVNSVLRIEKKNKKCSILSYGYFFGKYNTLITTFQCFQMPPS